MCINIPLLISFTTVALSSAPMGTCTARVGPICSWHESKDFFPQKNFFFFFLLQWGQRSLAISLYSPSYSLVVLLVEGCWGTYPHLAHLYKIVDIWGLQKEFVWNVPEQNYTEYVKFSFLERSFPIHLWDLQGSSYTCRSHWWKVRSCGRPDPIDHSDACVPWLEAKRIVYVRYTREEGLHPLCGIKKKMGALLVWDI